MNEVTTIGIDLAKRVFVLHGVDGTGQVMLHRMCRRAKNAPDPMLARAIRAALLPAT